MITSLCFGTPTQSSHHSALATSGGPQSCGHAEEYGSGPIGGALFSRAACTAQFSSTYRIALNASIGGRLATLPQRVDGAVVEHVLQRICRLARRLQLVGVVPVGEDGPAAAHHLVQRPRHPHLEALHRAAQRDVVGRLDDQVHVVPLNREVDQAESEPRAPPRKRPAQRAKTAMAAQVPDFPADPDGDVQSGATESAPRPVRYVATRRFSLSSRAFTRAAPLAERQLWLLDAHVAQRTQGV